MNTKVKNKIWEVRNEKGVKAKDLAKEIGISESALNYYETSRQSPTLDTIHDISRILGVKMEELYEDEPF